MRASVRCCFALWLTLCLLSGAAVNISAAEPVGPFQPNDWPWWRGQTRDGKAQSGQNPPLAWSETENLLWKTPIPGRGHGSPTVVANAVYLATADEQAETRSVLALHRDSGQLLWSCLVHQGSPTPPRNARGTQASSTVACDGHRLFINFLHDGAMFTSAITLEGKLLGQTRVADYIVHQGYGSSPAIFEGLCIVSADSKAGGAIAALDRRTGNIVWKVDRPQLPNYPSPILLKAAGKTQLLMTGCDLVTSLNPRTGEKFWEIPGATTECVTSTLTNGDLIYTSGGYPENHVSAVRADGSGELVWKNGSRVYVPSMLIHEGYLYGIMDAGVAVCWNASTGEEIWKGRLQGTFSSSPVLVGSRIYVINESGETFVFEAKPQQFELLARNQLGQECFATPAICGSRIYTRIASSENEQRQEYLYCLGKK